MIPGVDTRAGETLRRRTQAAAAAAARSLASVFYVVVLSVMGAIGGLVFGIVAAVEAFSLSSADAWIGFVVSGACCVGLGSPARSFTRTASLHGSTTHRRRGPRRRRALHSRRRLLSCRCWLLCPHRDECKGGASLATGTIHAQSHHPPPALVPRSCPSPVASTRHVARGSCLRAQTPRPAARAAARAAAERRRRRRCDRILGRLLRVRARLLREQVGRLGAAARLHTRHDGEGAVGRVGLLGHGVERVLRHGLKLLSASSKWHPSTMRPARFHRPEAPASSSCHAFSWHMSISRRLSACMRRIGVHARAVRHEVAHVHRAGVGALHAVARGAADAAPRLLDLGRRIGRRAPEDQRLGPGHKVEPNAARANREEEHAVLALEEAALHRAPLRLAQ